MPKPPTYPDISDILAMKAKGRMAQAALSFAEKLAILDDLKQASKEFTPKGALGKRIERHTVRQKGLE